MKERKALKRLHRVSRRYSEQSLDQYDARTPELHELLSAARSSVVSVNQSLIASPVRKTVAKADQSQPRNLSNSARKRLSLAAKKRWAVAKRNGMTTLARTRSQKIA
jgi:hypothetical protein